MTRQQLSYEYGGSPQDTFPRPRAELLARHGRAHFMCINFLWNPHAPARPGTGGLFFGHVLWPDDPYRNGFFQDVQTVFVRLRSGAWQYIGEYEMSHRTPLSAVQFQVLHSKVSAGSVVLLVLRAIALYSYCNCAGSG